MIWLNLKTTTLRSPEYAGSEPIQRATWLNLLAYCCEQENGGRIDGCGEWKDRQWQQTLGVTLGEVREDCALWHWEGDVLCVAFYPTDKQEEVKAKREAGKRGGSAKTQAKTQAARINGAKLNPSTNPSTNPSRTQAEPKLTPNGKERKDKGKIKEGEDAREEVWKEPTREEVIEAGRKVGLTAEQADIWRMDHLARPITPTGQWTGRDGQPVNNWQYALGAWAGRWRENARAKTNGAIVPLNGHTKPESVWSLQQRIEAAQKEVDRICANPANKGAVPYSFDRRLKAEPAAKVKQLKASISEMRQRLAGVEVAA